MNPLHATPPAALLILAGRKTVSRLRITPPPGCRFMEHAVHLASTHGSSSCAVFGDDGAILGRIPVPYRASDRVYLAEPWTLVPPRGCAPDDPRIRYQADEPEARETLWAPARQMPPNASRALLVVLGLRPERLQDITDDDLSGGEAWTRSLESPPCTPAAATEAACVDMDYLRNEFANAWNRAHDGDGTWDLNPWVWRIEYRVDPNQEKKKKRENG